MGLSVAAGTLVLSTALILSGGHLLFEMMEGTASVALASREFWARRDFREHTSLSVHSVVWSGIIVQTLSIEVENSGITALTTAHLNVLLDGVLRDDDVTSVTMDGLAFENWLPGETVVIEVRDVATSPLFVSVVAEGGIFALWRPA